MQVDSTNQNQILTPGLWKEQRAADWLGVSVKTLQTWRCRRPDLLPFVKVGRSVRYRAADLEKFVQDNLVQQ